MVFCFFFIRRRHKSATGREKLSAGTAAFRTRGKQHRKANESLAYRSADSGIFRTNGGKTADLCHRDGGPQVDDDRLKSPARVFTDVNWSCI